jgi:hypothetical protein
MLAAALIALTWPAHAVAASPACGNVVAAEPVQFYSPGPLTVKVFVGGCYWNEAERGHTVIVTVRLSGPGGYTNQLIQVAYPLPLAGPFGAPWVYSVSGVTGVPQAGTYTLSVDEQYPYVATPVSALSTYTTSVLGTPATPVPSPTAAATPRPTVSPESTSGPTPTPASPETQNPTGDEQTPASSPSSDTSPFVSQAGASETELITPASSPVTDGGEASGGAWPQVAVVFVLLSGILAAAWAIRRRASRVDA